MSPEWQRRTVVTFLTVLSTAPIRKVEPVLAAATGLPGVWITRITAIAILVLCFKLADMIPDRQWRYRGFWRPRMIHAVLLLISGMMLTLLYGVAH